jgi:hypothetical protein
VGDTCQCREYHNSHREVNLNSKIINGSPWSHSWLYVVWGSGSGDSSMKLEEMIVSIDSEA